MVSCWILGAAQLKRAPQPTFPCSWDRPMSSAEATARTESRAPEGPAGWGRPERGQCQEPPQLLEASVQSASSNCKMLPSPSGLLRILLKEHMLTLLNCCSGVYRDDRKLFSFNWWLLIPRWFLNKLCSSCISGTPPCLVTKQPGAPPAAVYAGALPIFSRPGSSPVFLFGCHQLVWMSGSS